MNQLQQDNTYIQIKLLLTAQCIIYGWILASLIIRHSVTTNIIDNFGFIENWIANFSTSLIMTVLFTFPSDSNCITSISDISGTITSLMSLIFRAVFQKLIWKINYFLSLRKKSFGLSWKFNFFEYMQNESTFSNWTVLKHVSLEKTKKLKYKWFFRNIL